ncbi:hypothetical protein BDW66DRAFT_132176 [Aspergillus desertorum]
MEKERREQAEEHTRPTTFLEFLCHSHNLLSRPLRVETPSRSTTGKKPLFPTVILPDPIGALDALSSTNVGGLLARQQLPSVDTRGVTTSVSSLHELEGLGRLLCRKPISSEQELEA